MSAARRNLVVVRAGKNSLHPTWLNGEADRNWDLIVSLYDPEAHFPARDDVQIAIQRGGKWDGLYKLFSSSELLNQYEFVWLPDDDIAAHKRDINAIFDAMRQHQLEVAQPALTRESYFSHFLVMQCPGFTLRYSNFVEVMVPCLTAALLRQILDDFRDSESGFGMDFLWTRLAAEPRYKAAILDSIAVRHTRPVGRELRTKMAARGQSPEVDRASLQARHGLEQSTLPLVYSAIDAEGRRVEGCTGLGWQMACRYLGALAEFPRKLQAIEKIVQVIRRQTGKQVNITSLRRNSSTVR